MKNVIFIIGLKFFGLGVTEDKRHILTNHHIDLKQVAQLCLDYYKVFCMNMSGRLAVADPLFITYVVREKLSAEFDAYVLDAMVKTDPRVRYSIEKLLELLGMVAYIFLLDIENKINDIVNGSGYDVRDIMFNVHYCDYDRLEVEVRYVPFTTTR